MLVKRCAVFFRHAHLDALIVPCRMHYVQIQDDPPPTHSTLPDFQCCNLETRKFIPPAQKLQQYPCWPSETWAASLQSPSPEVNPVRAQWIKCD